MVSRTANLSVAPSRLLLVTPDFPPHLLGGGGVVCQRLATEYHRAGWEVEVLSMNTSRSGWWARPQTSVDSGITVTFLPMATRPRLGRLSLLLSIPPSIPGLIWLLRELRKDRWRGIHLHGHPSTLIELTSALLRLRGRRFVMTFHGVLQHSEALGTLGRRVYQLVLRGERWAFSGASALTAVSQATLKDVRSAGFRCPTLVMIPNGSFEPFPPSGQLIKDPASELESSSVQPGEFALCLGAYTPRKGQMTALEAFAALISSRSAPDTLGLVFAGYERDPEFLGTLRRRAAELGLTNRVQFLGPVSDARKWALLQYARWVLMPSTYEASPVLAFEALAAGCVLVTSDLESFREIIGDSGSAISFRAGDARSLEGALAGLLANPEHENRLRTFAQERARSLPTWDEVAARYLALLEGSYPGRPSRRDSP